MDRKETVSSSNKRSTALDKGIQLMDHIIRTNGAMSITEISQYLGVTRLTAYSLVNTLTDWKILKRDPDTLQYSMEYRLSLWGMDARKQFLPLSPCEQGLQNFVATTGLPIKQAHLSSLVDNAEKAFRFFMPLGASANQVARDIFSVSSADGLLLLAFQPAEARAKVLEKYRSTANETDEAINYEEIFEKIRTQDISYIGDLDYPYNIEIAAPIRNADGIVVAAVCFILSKSAYLSTESEIRTTLQALANDLSLSIGYPGQNGEIFLNRRFEY